MDRAWKKVYPIGKVIYIHETNIVREKYKDFNRSSDLLRKNGDKVGIKV